MKYSRAGRLSCATGLVVGNPAKNKAHTAKVASTTDFRPILLLLIATIPASYTVLLLSCLLIASAASHRREVGDGQLVDRCGAEGAMTGSRAKHLKTRSAPVIPSDPTIRCKALIGANN